MGQASPLTDCVHQLSEFGGGLFRHGLLLDGVCGLVHHGVGDGAVGAGGSVRYAPSSNHRQRQRPAPVAANAANIDAPPKNKGMPTPKGHRRLICQVMPFGLTACPMVSQNDNTPELGHPLPSHLDMVIVLV